MKIIAVAGGSGCGKTFFTELLVNRLSETVVLPLDSYYLDKPEQIPVEKYDFDSPDAFDFKLYRMHLDSLLSGTSIQKPNFNYNLGKRENKFTRLGYSIFSYIAIYFSLYSSNNLARRRNV